MTRYEIGWALLVGFGLIFALACRWFYWRAREERRRLAGRSPRHFALIGLGRRQSDRGWR